MKLMATALEEINTLAKEYAAARAVLSERVTDLNDEVRAIHRRRVPGIKTALSDTKAAQERLAAAIKDHPHFFVKPRTFTVHGIKIGFQKGTGSITWEDDEQLIKLIRKTFAQEMTEALIMVSYKPSKEALARLPAKDLQRLGVTVKDAGDFIVVKPADGNVDKLVKAILDEGLVEEASES